MACRPGNGIGSRGVRFSAGARPRVRQWLIGCCVLLLATAEPVMAQGSLGADANDEAIPDTGTAKSSANASYDAGGEDERFQVASFDWDRVQTPMLLGLSLLACALTKLVFHYHHKLSSLFPESCLLVLIGVIIGIALYVANVRDVVLGADVFFLYLVPPLITDAGFFVPNRTFFDNLGTILLFGVVGTILNTLALGAALWGVAPVISTVQCLVFAAVMSAVDPVSVLAVFDDAHVTECLYIIVFGESLVNNGIAVVLYHIFVGLTELGPENIGSEDIWLAVGSFVLITTFSILIGVFFAVVAVLLTRISDHVPVVQPLFVIVFGYLAYIFAEMFHFSGILACALCGMMMRKYVKVNMSKKSHTTTRYFLKLLASICETVIFIYLGIITVVNAHQWNTTFCLLTLVFCLVLRSGILIILTLIINCGRLPKLTLVDQFILSYGGLRGAIAFCLFLDLDEDLFPMKKMFFTSAVLVIMFTNFIMGSTIKPLAKALKGKRIRTSKPSLNDQIHERLIDHLMSGIEDIAGHHGHHKLRERFEYLDKHYLQKVFVRQSRVTKNGWNTVNNYDKLSAKEARELEQNTDYSAMLRQIQPENGIIRNFSFMRWLSTVSHGCFPYGYPPFGISDMKPNDQAEQTLVDLQAMEYQNTRKMRDDSKVHHIIEDSMFVPRKRFLGHPRHTVPPDSYSHVQLHHKARLHLRHLMSHHHHRHSESSTHGCNGSARNNGHNNKPKKNVSFAEVTQVTKVCDLCTPLLTKQNSQDSKDDGEADIGSTHAESGLSGEDTDSDIGGITFTASAEDTDTQSDIPVEPVAVEMSLPWKRNTGREPMPSAMKHSMPDDQNPLIGEAPSWVANTEYTSPGSPPLTPQTQHHEGQSAQSLASTDQDTDTPDLILLETPDHKPSATHDRCDIRDSENHDQTDGGQTTSGAIQMDTSCDQVQAGPAAAGDPSAALDKNRTQHTEPSGRSEMESLPWRSDAHNQSAPACSQAQLPWRHNSYSCDDHPLPWRDSSAREMDHPLPWRQQSTESGDEMSVSTNRRTKDSMINDEPCLPPPWLDNKSSNRDKDDISSPTAKLPWRDNSNIEVKLDQCAPRPRHPPPPSHPSLDHDSEDELSHIPPPPWRHTSTAVEPDCSVRSPSASCEVDVYSLRPQLSSHSFRISEAESKHSEPVHVHHMIEVPQPRPHIDFDINESSPILDLDSEEASLNERIAHWLMTCDPQPLDDDLEQSGSASKAGDLCDYQQTCASSLMSGDVRRINNEQEVESVV